MPAGCDVAYVYLGAYEWRTYLWRPIPYVKNLARWVDGHQLAGGIWVYPDGTVFESRLVNDELTCRLDVTKMPFDTQKCEIVYGMYINDETSVQLRLLPQAGGPVEIDDTKYNVQNTWKLGPRRGWETLVMYLGGSRFMEVTLQVEVYRRSAYYVSTVMIPCVLFLFIQYAGFFVDRRAGKESEIPNFKGSYLGRFPLVSADFWTSDHLLERPRSVDAFSGTRARGTLTLKRT